MVKQKMGGSCHSVNSQAHLESGERHHMAGWPVKENVSQDPFLLHFCLLPVLRWGAPYLPFVPLTLSLQGLFLE